MIAAFSSASSGLSASARQIAVAAHNIANVHTEGFEPGRVVLQATHPSGVQAHTQTLQRPESLPMTAPHADGRPVMPANVDLPDDMTTLLVAKRAYQASLSVLEAEHERVGHLLDLRG